MMATRKGSSILAVGKMGFDIPLVGGMASEKPELIYLAGIDVFAHKSPNASEGEGGAGPSKKPTTFEETRSNLRVCTAVVIGTCRISSF